MELSWFCSFMGTKRFEVMNVWKIPHGIWSIVDKRTHKVIQAGHITTYKNVIEGNNSYIFVGFDNIHYYNFHGTDKYHCTNVLEDDVELKSIPDDYNVVPWLERWTTKYIIGEDQFKKQLTDPSTIDVYLEKDLDPEVVLLVHALNSIPDVETITSCSGHNEISLEVDLYCYSFESVSFLINDMPDYINFSKAYAPNKNNAVAFKIITNGIGQEAYKQANMYAYHIIGKLQCK